MGTTKENVLLCQEIAAEETVGCPTYEELAEEYTDAWFDFE